MEGLTGLSSAGTPPTPTSTPTTPTVTALCVLFEFVDFQIESWYLTCVFCVADPSMLRGAMCGHTDSVWGLVYSSAHQRLLSCSADGTVRLWDANTTSPALAVFNEDKSTDLKIVSWPFLKVVLELNCHFNIRVSVFLCTRARSSFFSRPGVQ